MATWTPDAEFGVFPVGARAKEAYFAPDDAAEVIKGGVRYLFKRSKRSYPDQFWGEVVAYRIGCLLGVPVPPAFYGINSDTHVAAALIEWFYEPLERFIHGGDFLVRLRPGYDRDVGTQHNLEDIRRLSQALRLHQNLSGDWKQWWVDALLFDALIGNTDRHQDNWGIVYGQKSPGMPARPARFAPLFDNGTSLGHERFPVRIAGWRPGDYERYIARGSHHMKWTLEDPVDGHEALLRKVLAMWPHTREVARARLDQIHEDELETTIIDLLQLPGPEQLTKSRYDFIVRLLRLRFQNLRKLLDDAP